MEKLRGKRSDKIHHVYSDGQSSPHGADLLLDLVFVEKPFLDFREVPGDDELARRGHDGVLLLVMAHVESMSCDRINSTIPFERKGSTTAAYLAGLNETL